MSAILCGKRSFFEELTGSPTSPPNNKRIRCSSTSPVRFSPILQSPAPIYQLTAVFPHMDMEVLERALQECGNDVDSAIKSLHELCLGYGKGSSSAGMEPNGNLEKASTVVDADPLENTSAQENLPADGAEWVELLVREMTSATSVDDARSRASRVLESLEKSICTRVGVEAAQNILKENVMLKEQIEVFLRENNILKRAVAIQHERQKDYIDKDQEVQHLKQMVSQYQEQLRTLEVNNYALTMHLRQAQGGNSIPGRFHPDVF